MHKSTASVACAALLLAACLGSGQARPRSFVDLRSEGVVRQSEWFTCGPAAVATLLTFTYGQPTTEAAALALALEGMSGSTSDPRSSGLSAFALQHALQELGFASRGMRVAWPDLVAYFRAGGLPVIAHVTRPELHFVVVVGVIGDFVVLSDPSWGGRVLPLQALAAEKGYSGVVLVPLPDAAQAHRAKGSQDRQLGEARQRLARLGAS